MNRRKEIDIEKLKRLYLDEGKTLRECGVAFGVSYSTVRDRLGSETRKPGIVTGSKRPIETKRKMSVAQRKLHADETIPKGKKRCPNCKRVLPHSAFEPRGSRMGDERPFSWCKQCMQTAKNNYKSANREKVRKAGRVYAQNHKEQIQKINKKWSARVKRECFEAYGGVKCACCGTEHMIFLTIDHINGGGSQHRKQIKGRNMYFWLKKNGYPPGYRVLCFNCNFAEAHGGCPHGL